MTPEPTQRDIQKAKIAMRRHVLEMIYQPLEERFKASVAELVARNTEIGKFSHAGFVFAGVRYGALWNARDRRPLPALLPELVPLMLELVREQCFINRTELPKVSLALTELLTQSSTTAQFAEQLPETLRQIVLRAPIFCQWGIGNFAGSSTELSTAVRITPIEEGLQLLRERLVRNLIDL